MESRLQHILLIWCRGALRLAGALVLCAGALPAWAAEPAELELEPLMVREPARREVEIDALDSENFEIGAFGGIMNVEDFGTDTVTGLRAAYHVSEDFFVEGIYGRTTLGQTSFERLSGGAPLLTDAERDAFRKKSASTISIILKSNRELKVNFIISEVL